MYQRYELTRITVGGFEQLFDQRNGSRYTDTGLCWFPSMCMRVRRESDVRIASNFARQMHEVLVHKAQNVGLSRVIRPNEKVDLAEWCDGLRFADAAVIADRNSSKQFKTP